MSKKELKTVPKRKVWLGAMGPPKFIYSSVASLGAVDSPKDINFDHNKINFKVNMLLPEPKLSNMKRVYSLNRIRLPHIDIDSQPIFDDEALSKRSREQDTTCKEMTGNAYISMVSDIDTSNGNSLAPISVLGNLSKLTQQQRRPTPTHDVKSSIRDGNIGKLMDSMQALKTMASKAGSEPTRKKAKLCQNILSLLSREEGKYQEEIKFLRAEIRNSIICSSVDLLNRIEAISPTILQSMTLLSAPYFELTRRLVDYMENYQKEVQESQKKDQQEIARLNAELEMILCVPDGDPMENQKKKFELLMYEFNNSLDEIKKQKDKIYTDFASVKFDAEDIEAAVDSAGLQEVPVMIKTLVGRKTKIEEQIDEIRGGIEKMRASISDIVTNYKDYSSKFAGIREQILFSKNILKVQEIIVEGF